jgi:hypothetical protein
MLTELVSVHITDTFLLYSCVKTFPTKAPA